MSIAAQTLNERLAKSLGDYIQVAVTTNITTDTLLVSTGLQAYDNGEDTTFEDWWAYVINKNNAGEDRKVRNYYTANGACNCFGAAFSADTNIADIRLHRYGYSTYQKALNDAVFETFPHLHEKVDNKELITNNILPPYRWASSSTLSKYVGENATLAKTTTAGYYRNGKTSCKVTATAANGHLLLSSDNYSRLLDLEGQKVSIHCWVNPEQANDPVLELYTLKNDGVTSQRLISTTAAPANTWSFLSLEDQTLNDDLTRIEVRLAIKTNAKYAYFDPPWLIGRQIYELMLPEDLQKGEVRQVYIQSSSYDSAHPASDIHQRGWDRMWNTSIVEDGTDRYIRLPDLFTSQRRLRLMGIKPLATVESATDTINLDNESLPLLLAYAKYKVFQMVGDPVTTQQAGRYKTRSAEALGEYFTLLPRLGMPKPSTTIKFRGY